MAYLINFIFSFQTSTLGVDPDNKVLNLKGNIINLAVNFLKNALSEILDMINKNINLL